MSFTNSLSNCLSGRFNFRSSEHKVHYEVSSIEHLNIVNANLVAIVFLNVCFRSPQFYYKFINLYGFFNLFSLTYSKVALNDSFSYIYIMIKNTKLKMKAVKVYHLFCFWGEKTISSLRLIVAVLNHLQQFFIISILSFNKITWFPCFLSHDICVVWNK